jgi:phosphatidylethanolamine-binding protein (PEBP) family uncharacterized protein
MNNLYHKFHLRKEIERKKIILSVLLGQKKTTHTECIILQAALPLAVTSFVYAGVQGARRHHEHRVCTFYYHLPAETVNLEQAVCTHFLNAKWMSLIKLCVLQGFFF